MDDCVLETLFEELVFLVSSVLGWEIRVVRWIRRREAVQKNVPFRNSEIGRSSSILELPRFACRGFFECRWPVVLAAWLLLRGADLVEVLSSADFSLRVGALWEACRFGLLPRCACNEAWVLRVRGAAHHPRPAGITSIFLLF